MLDHHSTDASGPRAPGRLETIRQPVLPAAHPDRGLSGTGRATSWRSWLGFARDRRPRFLRGPFATFPFSCSAPPVFAAQRWAPAARTRPEQAFASRARAITGECSHRRDATPHQPRCRGNLLLRHAVLMGRYRAHPQRWRVIVRARASTASWARGAGERLRE